MRIASSDGKHLGAKRIVHTPANFKDGMALFSNVVRDLAGRRKVQAIVGGIAGPLNKTKTRVIGAPHLPGWNNQPLAVKLAKMSDGSVSIENDTAMGGLGEAVYGAGKGRRIVVYYTISTGVGGVRIVNHKIDEHTLGFEPGHQVIGCIKHHAKDQEMELIYLEDYISGSGLNVRYQKDPKLIKSKTVWTDVARWLSLGLNNSIVHWSPEVIVLGGSLITSGAISLPKVREYLKKMVRIFPRIPQIKRSKLGDLVGLYGALAYLKQEGK